MNNLLTLEEVKNFLEVEERDLEKFLKEGKLHVYKIGGTYLRFRKEEVMDLRLATAPRKIKPSAKITVFSHVADFWRFNNFYILSLLVVGILIFLIFKF